MRAVSSAIPTVATHGELAVPASVCRLALLADPDLRHVRTVRCSVDVDPHDEDRATSGRGSSWPACVFGYRPTGRRPNPRRCRYPWQPASVSVSLNASATRANRRPCGSVQNPWAEQRQNRARADVDEASQAGRTAASAPATPSRSVSPRSRRPTGSRSAGSRGPQLRSGSKIPSTVSCFTPLTKLSMNCRRSTGGSPECWPLRRIGRLRVTWASAWGALICSLLRRDRGSSGSRCYRSPDSGPSPGGVVSAGRCSVAPAGDQRQPPSGDGGRIGSRWSFPRAVHRYGPAGEPDGLAGTLAVSRLPAPRQWVSAPPPTSAGPSSAPQSTPGCGTTERESPWKRTTVRPLEARELLVTPMAKAVTVEGLGCTWSLAAAYQPCPAAGRDAHSRLPEPSVCSQFALAPPPTSTKPEAASPWHRGG